MTVSLFSAATQRIIENFAAELGAAAELAPDNSYGFEFERSGVLSLVPSQDGRRIVICLARDIQQIDSTRFSDFLKLAGPNPSLGTMLHTAIGENGTPVLATSIEESDLTPGLLDRTVSTLIELYSVTLKRLS